MPQRACLVDSPAMSCADVCCLPPLRHRSDVERVLHRVRRPPRAVQNLLAHLSHGRPGSAERQELLRVLWGEDERGQGIAVTRVAHTNLHTP